MRTLASLTYKECPPIVTAESMRFLDGDTKRSRVSNSGFHPLWDMQTEPAVSDSNEFASPIDAGYALMKLAGKALFRRVRKILGEDAEGKSVAIFVGGGNNGGDGLALASNLIEAGIPCTVYSLAKAESFKDEASLAYQDFVNNGGKLV